VFDFKETAAGSVVVVLAALVAIGCGGSGSSKDDDHGGGGPKTEANDWATFGGDLGQNRHVSFSQITPDNVGKLGLAWSTNLAKSVKDLPGGQQSSPLVIDGKLYVTASFDHAFQLDAKTGDVGWHHVPKDIGVFKNFGVTANRGMAYCDGSLFMLTLDMRLQKLDPDTGSLIKEVKISDAVKDAKAEYGYYESSAPVCDGKRLFVGSSGGDNGVRGFIMAYDTGDLSGAWGDPFWTVPPEGQGWRAHGRFHGGGSVWTPPTVDTENGNLVFAIANPSPDFFATLRPGKNENTNSLAAVDEKTGKLQWVQQQLSPDEWDYDTAQGPVVFDTEINGQSRRLAATATKEGKWFAYDAKTGEPVYEGVKVIDVVDHPRLVPGKPITISPSTLGGVNYAPASFDPDLDLMIENGITSKSQLVQEKSAKEVDEGRVRGDVDTGAVNGFGETPKGWHDYGNVTAIDTTTGKVAWKVKTPEPERGGSTTTATGLTFTGGGDGNFRALDTKTGRTLWSFQTGHQIAAPPVIYTLGGTEYVAVALGGTFTSSNGPNGSLVMAFKLGGSTPTYDKPDLVPEAGDVAKATTETGLQQYLHADPKEPGALELVLIASKTGKAGGMNFDGFSRGDMTVTVPKGTKVNVTFRNSSAQLPHSALVTDFDKTNETSDFPVAFDGAETDDPDHGIKSGSQFFSFTADTAGKFAIVCAVPGHAAAGMWDTLVVSDGGTPKIEAKGEKSVTVPLESPHAAASNAAQ
jgi:PQQ-dependent dehydrogenase (methanol/ethanol family)